MSVARLDLAGALARVRGIAATALAERGRVELVVPGGRGPQALLTRWAELGLPGAGQRLFVSDERCVGPDDAASNARAVREVLAPAVPGAEVVGPDLASPPEAAARRYAALVDGVERFDAVLLGLGADGHTASLFPGDERGFTDDADGALVVDVPGDAHPRRITLAARTLARTDLVLVLVAGTGKDAAVAAIDAGEDVPVNRLVGPERVLVDLRDA